VKYIRTDERIIIDK